MTARYALLAYFAAIVVYVGYAAYSDKRALSSRRRMADADARPDFVQDEVPGPRRHPDDSGCRDRAHHRNPQQAAAALTTHLTAAVTRRPQRDGKCRAFPFGPRSFPSGPSQAGQVCVLPSYLESFERAGAARDCIRQNKF